MAEQNSLHRLVEQARFGHKHAISQLYTKYYRAMYRTARRQLRRHGVPNHVHASDVIDSVFARIVRNPRVLHEQGAMSFARYADKAVVNKVRDIMRHLIAEKRDCRRTLHAEPSQMEQLPLAERRPGDARSGAELLQALARLPRQEQEIVAWRRNGESWHQIGDRLNSSADAVRRRLAKALGRIQQKRAC